MDTIILEKSERQIHAAQGEGYSKHPGYHIWYQGGGTGDSYLLGYVEERFLDTALWFYMQEENLAVVVVDGDKQTKYK